MNIFYLDTDPVLAAQYQHDKHVVKMILETAQILSTVLHKQGINDPLLYKPTHANHPCTLWAGACDANYTWLVLHGEALCAEYTYRYGRTHKSAAVIAFAKTHAWGTCPHTPPAQAMPPEYQCPHDPVQAYRAYYLGRKVEQSNWTRRPVPAFLNGAIMAKKSPAKAAAKEVAAVAIEKAADSSAKQVIGVRGPKGVELTAVITVLAGTNPKRAGSAAAALWELYVDGMTIQQFLDAGGTTAALVYDASHSFIAIEGYNPKLVEKKVREPKAAKPKKEKKAKSAEAVAAEEDLNAAAAEETID